MIPSPRSAHEGPQLTIGRGARATESLVLEHLETLLDESERRPELLAKPVRVVVPSRSLRVHLAARLVRRRGRSLAGVDVSTLRRLAGEILARMGVPAPAGGRLFPVLVQRAVRNAAALREDLEAFENGYEVLHGAVRDLIDAGFDAAVADAMDERLAEFGSATDSQVLRARGIVRVAREVVESLERLGGGDPSSVLRRAAECVREDPERAVSARAVIIYGFAEATGVAADLLQALVLHVRANAYLDEPPDPADPGKADRGVAFTVRLRERLQGHARVVRQEAPAESEPRSMFRAAGAQAQARIVAARVRALLDEGVDPEAIGIVARGLETVQRPLCLQLGRLGIPYSCWGGDGSASPLRNRLRAAVLLLQAGEAASTDAWLAARGGRRTGALDLKVALRAAGCARLAEVAALAPAEVLDEQGSFPLPLRRGLAGVGPGGESDPAEGGKAVRRRLDGRDLRAAVAAARAVLTRLRRWPVHGAFDRHAGQLRDLLFRDLGWTEEEARPVTSAAAAVAVDVPAAFALTRDEFVLLVGREVDAAGRVPLGGAGGGVQLLDATNARSRTFDHLFVVGLNRDAFPRRISEDPLIPDRVRGALQPVLPDIPVKRAGHNEERYLFAQLLSAARRVTLSWLVADDDGKPLAPSPLVERLLDTGGVDTVPLLAEPGGVDSPGPEASALCTASEHALRAALVGSRTEWSERLAVAMSEFGDASRASRTPEDVAGARRLVVDEVDPDLSSAAGRDRARRVGPYLGFIGARAGGIDPRGALWVTTLEAIAACPWQAFLRRLLRLEPMPDPLGDVPEVTGAVIGNVVHGALEAVARSGAPVAPALADAISSVAVAARWPDPASLRTIVSESARAVVRDQGLRVSGLHHLLVELALPFVEAAGAADWARADGVSVLGAEVVGELRIRDSRGAARSVTFKADLIDRLAEIVRLTDYKTGTPISTAAGEGTRRRHFLDRVAAGSALQAVAYALAVGAGALGRYLYLRPRRGDSLAEEFIVESGDAEFAAAFGRAVGIVIAAHDAGAFFPRVFAADEAKEPDRCGYCEVQEACVRGDSGARARLVAAAEVIRAAEGSRVSRAEEAFSELWRIAVKQERPGGDVPEARE